MKELLEKSVLYVTNADTNKIITDSDQYNRIPTVNQ